MASDATDLTEKVFQELANSTPQEYQKLRGDGGKYAEIHALVNQVVNENLTVSTSLRGKLKSASTAEIQRVLSRTYSSDQIETMRHGFEAETFRMSIEKRQGFYIVSTTRNQTHIFPQRRLETLADIDWAMFRQRASVLVEAVLLFGSCVGISMSISERYIAEVTEKTVEMIRQPACMRAYDAFVDAWNGADSSRERATAIFVFLKDSYSMGIFWKVFKLICMSMSWWDWIRTAAQLAATLVAAFATEGVAIIARIVLALDAAQAFFEKISNLNRLNAIKME